MMVVEAVNLRKIFAGFTALDDVSFTVAAGEIVGLIGPNGAGKSTTLHLLLGLITRTAGALRIFGHDPELSREMVFARLNFTSPYAGLPPRLTVVENLSIYARLYGIARPRAKIDYLLAQLDSDDLLHKTTGRLSSGETARVMLCKALLNDPDLLILDEPTANLDTVAADKIQALLARRRLEQGTAVLMTSHNLGQVEDLCDRVVVVDRGRVVAAGSSLDVTRSLFDPHADRGALADVFRKLSSRAEPRP